MIVSDRSLTHISFLYKTHRFKAFLQENITKIKTQHKMCVCVLCVRACVSVCVCARVCVCVCVRACV